MATRTVPVSAAPGEGRLSAKGILARGVVAALIAGAVLVAPLFVDEVWNGRIAFAATFAIIGLSVNIITGHAGQLSLGHQAFVGIGAFMSAYVVSRLGLGFVAALLSAAVVGAVMALVLGLAALRIRGLYLALLTLAFGLVAETSVFAWRAFTQGGAGQPAPRPALFASDRAYAYLTLMFLALFLFIDWRLVKSKAGRAIVAFRNDERVAATLGVNVTAYKLLAFVVGGFVAGVAGSILAHRNEFAQAEDFTLEVALVWVLMAVVGGLGSRAGVVIGSVFFALFQDLLPDLYGAFPGWMRRGLLAVGVDEVTIVVVTPLLGAILLVLTLTSFPGGIGQQLLPLRRWLAGGKFIVHEKKRHGRGKAKEPGDRMEAEEPSQKADRWMPGLPPAPATSDTATALQGSADEAGRARPAERGMEAPAEDRAPTAPSGRSDASPDGDPAPEEAAAPADGARSGGKPRKRRGGRKGPRKGAS